MNESQNGWTTETLRIHFQEMRELQDKFELERDRRYSELSIEREKSSALLAESHKTALNLAREIQTYKDEKANELRSQIERERGSYVTHGELSPALDRIMVTIQPAIDYAKSQSGTRAWTTPMVTAMITLFLGLAAIVAILLKVKP